MAQQMHKPLPEDWLASHVDWLYAAALRQVKDPHLAEDVVQATCLLAARRRGQLVQHPKPAGWLFRTLCLCAKEILRRERRQRRRDQEAARMKPEISANDSLDWKALSPLLDDAVQRLSGSDREAILLRFYQQLPMAGVGAALGISEDAAKKRVGRAVDRLRQRLTTQGLPSSSAALSSVLLSSASPSAPPQLLQALLQSASPAAAKLAAAARRMMVLAKAKMAAAIFMLAGAAAGVTVAVSPSWASHASGAAPAGPGSVLLGAGLQMPPIREGKEMAVLCRTGLLLPQSALEELVAASKELSATPDLQTRSGPSRILRPILRNLLPQAVGRRPVVAWPQGRGFNDLNHFKQFTFKSKGSEDFITFEPKMTVSDKDAGEFAGSFTITGGVPSLTRDYTIPPTSIEPGSLVVQIAPLPLKADQKLSVVLVYEVVTVDESDQWVLRELSDGAGWLKRPIAESLRTVRAGTVWLEMAPRNRMELVRDRATRLPGGARIWVTDISDPAVHPLLRWTSDGRPFYTQEASTQPTAWIRIADPNLPPRYGGPEKTYETDMWARLSRENKDGYLCSVAYGDGRYKTVASMPFSKGAKATVEGYTIEIAGIVRVPHAPADGEFRLSGQPPRDTDIDIVAVRKDGSVVWNWRKKMSLAEGETFTVDRSFAFDAPQAEIDHLEIRTRPFKWVTFDHLAKRPAVPLPTGLEAVVDREDGDRRRHADAVAAERKPGLDGITCVRVWTGGAATSQDLWVWQDGRFRVETWGDADRTLTLGDKSHVWNCDLATGRWKPGKSGRPQNTDFTQLLDSLGGMEEATELGEVRGQENVNGVPCTIRDGKMGPSTGKVWIDARGFIHRFDVPGPPAVNLIVDYAPANASGVWTPPADTSAPQ